MRIAVSALAVMLAIVSLSAQTDSASAPVVLPFGDQVLSYRKLFSERPGRLSITGGEGHVAFTLYYVETFCEEYDYSFEKDTTYLYIRHLVADTASCNSDENKLYGVRGTVSNLDAGTYLLILEFGDANGTNRVFQDVVVVK